jgi:pimeloyl-ACP methyl ester carboxylesterase
LSAAFQLRIPWRRGYAPSAITGRQDWERDARDLLRVMPERAHVVAHSYGGIGALIAAATAPERFQTLTLIEAPLWSVAADDPGVRKLAELGRAFANGAAEARAAFLELAWLPEQHPQTLRTERIARNFRDPGEAAPSLGTLRLAGVPVAVVSGSHNRAIERVCDALGAALAASRFILPGAGHAVARVPEFNTRLRDFVTQHSTR